MSSISSVPTFEGAIKQYQDLHPAVSKTSVREGEFAETHTALTRLNQQALSLEQKAAELNLSRGFLENELVCTTLLSHYMAETLGHELAPAFELSDEKVSVFTPHMQSFIKELAQEDSVKSVTDALAQLPTSLQAHDRSTEDQKRLAETYNQTVEQLTLVAENREMPNQQLRNCQVAVKEMLKGLGYNPETNELELPLMRLSNVDEEDLRTLHIFSQVKKYSLKKSQASKVYSALHRLLSQIPTERELNNFLKAQTLEAFLRFRVYNEYALKLDELLAEDTKTYHYGKKSYAEKIPSKDTAELTYQKRVIAQALSLNAYVGPFAELNDEQFLAVMEEAQETVNRLIDKDNNLVLFDWLDDQVKGVKQGLMAEGLLRSNLSSKIEETGIDVLEGHWLPFETSRCSVSISRSKDPEYIEKVRELFAQKVQEVFPDEESDELDKVALINQPGDLAPLFEQGTILKFYQEFKYPSALNEFKAGFRQVLSNYKEHLEDYSSFEEFQVEFYGPGILDEKHKGSIEPLKQESSDLSYFLRMCLSAQLIEKDVETYKVKLEQLKKELLQLLDPTVSDEKAQKLPLIKALESTKYQAELAPKVALDLQNDPKNLSQVQAYFMLKLKDTLSKEKSIALARELTAVYAQAYRLLESFKTEVSARVNVETSSVEQIQRLEGQFQAIIGPLKGLAPSLYAELNQHLQAVKVDLGFQARNVLATVDLREAAINTQATLKKLKVQYNKAKKAFEKKTGLGQVAKEYARENFNKTVAPWIAEAAEIANEPLAADRFKKLQMLEAYAAASHEPALHHLPAAAPAVDTLSCNLESVLSIFEEELKREFNPQESTNQLIDQAVRQLSLSGMLVLKGSLDQIEFAPTKSLLEAYGEKSEEEIAQLILSTYFKVFREFEKKTNVQSEDKELVLFEAHQQVVQNVLKDELNQIEKQIEAQAEVVSRAEANSEKYKRYQDLISEAQEMAQLQEKVVKLTEKERALIPAKIKVIQRTLLNTDISLSDDAREALLDKRSELSSIQHFMDHSDKILERLRKDAADLGLASEGDLKSFEEGAITKMREFNIDENAVTCYQELVAQNEALEKQRDEQIQKLDADFLTHLRELKVVTEDRDVKSVAQQLKAYQDQMTQKVHNRSLMYAFKLFGERLSKEQLKRLESFHPRLFKPQVI